MGKFKAHLFCFSFLVDSRIILTRHAAGATPKRPRISQLPGIEGCHAGFVTDGPFHRHIVSAPKCANAGHVLCGVSQNGLARLKVFTSFFDGQCQDALAFAFRSVVSICEVHVCRGMG